MAASFGAANSDTIDAGASVTHAASLFSVWARFKLNVGGSGARMICCYRATNINFQLYVAGSDLAANLTQGGTPIGIGWVGGISENVEYRVGLRWETASGLFHLFADTDATLKDGGSFSTTSPDTDAPQHFSMGNNVGDTNTLNGILYEVGWWPGTFLSGAEFAAMGAGTPPATDPTDYWGLVSDAVATFGGHNGTVTGATFVAHSGANLYGAPPAAPTRRNLSLLGVS